MRLSILKAAASLSAVKLSRHSSAKKMGLPSAMVRTADDTSKALYASGTVLRDFSITDADGDHDRRRLTCCRLGCKMSTVVQRGRV